MEIKLCGFRREEDIVCANKVLPDYIGFVLAKSKRRVAPKELEKLTEILDKRIKSVGVFVNEDISEVLELSKFLQVIQLHGDENEEYIKALKKVFKGEIWKAVRAKTPKDIEDACCGSADRILIDSFVANAYGGTGKALDCNTVRNAEITKPFFIAGGLNTENIVSAIKETSPFGVDISSGIERNDFKDAKKINEIIAIIRRI
ncbi:MAG: phosphoribosylanthranilate isomerase [Clostridiales bacterium]|nr:phosphoribosylanthranilate isomerase [Clostridiales bacterium]